jgi:hypothetical protein
MKEVRYLIRLAHSGEFKPADQAQLLSRVRECVRPLQGQAVNLRVSGTAIEFDLFCPPDSELHAFLAALEPVGALLTYKRLDLPHGAIVPAKVMAEARALFNEERYWEVHEVLEDLWKQTKGQEKKLVQGLILTAAALVHAQRDELKVVQAMLEEAVLRLENQPSVYLGLNAAAFLRAVKKSIASKSLDFPPI